MMVFVSKCLSYHLGVNGDLTVSKVELKELSKIKELKIKISFFKKGEECKN
jgi:hypothetical protein